MYFLAIKICMLCIKNIIIYVSNQQYLLKKIILTFRFYMVYCNCEVRL